MKEASHIPYLSTNRLYHPSPNTYKHNVDQYHQLECCPAHYVRMITIHPLLTIYKRAKA